MMELSGLESFKWFMTQCVMRKKAEAQALVNGVATPPEEREKQVRLRQAFEDLEYWIEQRFASNKAQLDGVDQPSQTL